MILTILYILIILFFIWSYSIIDKNILRLYLKLLLNKNLFIFLKIGYEIEYNKKFSDLYTYIIIILLIIYIILFPILNMFYVILTHNKYNFLIHKQYYEICKNPLLIPDYECSWLNGLYCALKNIDLFKKFQNKIFWNNFFIKNNVKTPPIIGKIINKKIILCKHQNNNKKYIIKPIIGGLGKNISEFTTETILNIDNNKYIIQEKIIQKKIRGHFRIITIYNKLTNNYVLGYIYLCFNDKNKIASNNHNGGFCHEVNISKNTIRYLQNDDIYILSNYYSIDIINNIIYDSIKLHEKLPKYVITVGWDIMIENNIYYFLEGNIPHGTVFKNDKYFYQKSIYINKLIYNSIF
jgi:hypothetical protein